MKFQEAQKLLPKKYYWSLWALYLLPLLSAVNTIQPTIASWHEAKFLTVALNIIGACLDILVAYYIYMLDRRGIIWLWILFSFSVIYALILIIASIRTSFFAIAVAQLILIPFIAWIFIATYRTILKLVNIKKS